MEYNTSLSKLIIPEYGRNVQKMVHSIIDIENREKRNHQAKSIIEVMGNLNPHLRDVPDFKHKLWDHLFIMSDFHLDVDSPYDRPSKESFEEKFRNREWIDAARQQLTKAERAILYQTGFRFGKMTVTEAVLHMLQDDPLLPFLRATFTDEERLSNFSQLCIHFSNQSAKIPLVIQYRAETIAGACIWMTLKLFKVDDVSLRDPKPWYCKYSITHDALQGNLNCSWIFLFIVFPYSIN